MKILVRLSLTVLVVLVIFAVSQIVASERVEVVQLSTTNDAGVSETTRLWVVDHEGDIYIRGTADSGWYIRLIKEPQVILTRGEESTNYLAIPTPDKTEIVNQLMNAKYTWSDSYIGLFADRSNDIAIQLQQR